MIMPGFEFDGQHSDDFSLHVTKVRRSTLAESRDQFEFVPGRPSSWHFPQPPGDRTITAQLGVVDDGQTELIEHVSNIATWLRPTGRKQLIFDDDPDWYWRAVVGNIGEITELLEIGEWDAEFRCEAYKYSIAENSTSASAVADGGTFNVASASPIETPARVVVGATQGTSIVDPSITLGTTTITMIGTLASTDAVVFDAENALVLVFDDAAGVLAGSYDPSAGTPPADVDGDFFDLQLGVNPIVFNAVGAPSAGMSAFWRDRRL